MARRRREHAARAAALGGVQRVVGAVVAVRARRPRVYGVVALTGVESGRLGRAEQRRDLVGAGRDQRDCASLRCLRGIDQINNAEQPLTGTCNLWVSLCERNVGPLTGLR